MWPPETPYLTVDGIVKVFLPDFKGIVLIKRKNPPLGYALPGGFVDRGETVEEALVREMKEEINLDVKIEKLLGVYSDPNRDPRLHTASCVYVCSAEQMPEAGDDAKEAFVCKLEDIPWDELVFDHAEILRDYLTN
jgi:8-oxo-dGTP diphosphatase